MAALKNRVFGGGGFRKDIDFVDVEYDFAKDGGAIGALDIFEATKSCVVHLEHFHVKTAVLGTGLSLEVGKNNAGNFASVAVASLTLDSMHTSKTFTDAYEKTDITGVADVASSLNSTYFLLNTAAGGTQYYVWMNVSTAGVDPAVAGRTGIEVAFAAGSTNAQVATAVRNAIHAVSAAFSCSAVTTATFTVTNVVIGPCVDATDGTAATGFTIANNTQGSINGVKGVLLAAGDKITMAFRTAAATAGKINYVLKILSI
jgi:hypothetical protein